MKFEGSKLRALLLKNDLRQADFGWICGVHLRQVRAWVCGEYPVPQYAALLIMAFDEGLLDAKWLAKKIRIGVKFPPKAI